MRRAAHQRQRVGRVLVRVDDLVPRAEDDGRRARGARRELGPGRVLVQERRVPLAGDEGGDEALVWVFWMGG
jgi:hypothetical protein